jgi:hypothetical protein
MANIRKKGSGRTKGATSFMTVPLTRLNSYLKKNSQVVISRRWATTLGMRGKNVRVVEGNQFKIAA